MADQPLVCYGLKQFLATQQDIEVRGEAESVADALAKLDTLWAELALVSLPLGGENHRASIVQLKAKHPTLRVLAALRSAIRGLRAA